MNNKNPNPNSIVGDFIEHNGSIEYLPLMSKSYVKQTKKEWFKANSFARIGPDKDAKTYIQTYKKIILEKAIYKREKTEYKKDKNGNFLLDENGKYIEKRTRYQRDSNGNKILLKKEKAYYKRLYKTYKEYSLKHNYEPFITTGLNKNLRSLIIIDIDDNFHSFPEEVSSFFKIQPNYMILNLSNNHCQIGWFIKEHSIATKEGYELWKKTRQTMAKNCFYFTKLYEGDQKWSGVVCKNHNYCLINPEKFYTVVFHDDEIDLEDLYNSFRVRKTKEQKQQEEILLKNRQSISKKLNKNSGRSNVGNSFNSRNCTVFKQGCSIAMNSIDYDEFSIKMEDLWVTYSQIPSDHPYTRTEFENTKKELWRRKLNNTLYSCGKYNDYHRKAAQAKIKYKKTKREMDFSMLYTLYEGNLKKISEIMKLSYRTILRYKKAALYIKNQEETTTTIKQ